MKKLVTKNGEPVKFGSIIAVAANGSSKTNVSIITVTEDNWKELVKNGILKEVETEKQAGVLDVTLLEKNARRFFREMTVGESMFDRIRKTIRYIAIAIDSTYLDNIKDIKSVLYYVDIYNDLKLQSTNADYLKNYYKSVGYGLFRHVTEAKIAAEIIIGIIDDKQKS